MTSARRDWVCACGHPQTSHVAGAHQCRACACTAVQLHADGLGVEVLAQLEAGRPPWTAPLYRVRCRPCGTVYTSRSWLREIARRERCRPCGLARRLAARRPTTAPAGMTPGERFAHGTRSRYVSGCRCEHCRYANRVYSRERAQASRRGDGNPLVEAGPVRAHLLALRRDGIGRQSVADVAGVSRTAIARITTGTQRKLRAQSAARILAVTVDAAINDGHRIDARPTQALIRQLVREGYTRQRLAELLGYESPTLQLRGPTITARNARRVARLYRQLTAEADA